MENKIITEKTAVKLKGMLEIIEYNSFILFKKKKSTEVDWHTVP